MSKKFSLFSVYGIEAEYMIVDRDSLKVMPIADKILQKLNNGKVCNEVSVGKQSWSNELVNHVLEIKCTQPEENINELDKEFYSSLLKVNKLVEEHGAMLMPTAMNPWFNPMEETQLWPHGQREIYKLYNEIFDCRGHGWSNLQSVHINLPYANEAEFVKLHAAVRIVLPLIPALAASSPFYDGKKGESLDNRLSFYEKNQAKVPSIIGNIIPENVASIAEYKTILKGIYADISHYENAKTLQQPWLNSRAAIPKFDVGAVEIRLMDIQESSYMDFCLVHLIVGLCKKLVEKIDSGADLSTFTDSYLREVYEASKNLSSVENWEPLNQLYSLDSVSDFKSLRKAIIETMLPEIPTYYHKGLHIIATQGNLAERMLKVGLSTDLFKSLSHCLVENSSYEA